jgi:hypothetical protein
MVSGYEDLYRAALAGTAAHRSRGLVTAARRRPGSTIPPEAAA